MTGLTMCSSGSCWCASGLCPFSYTHTYLYLSISLLLPPVEPCPCWPMNRQIPNLEHRSPLTRSAHYLLCMSPRCLKPLSLASLAQLRVFDFFFERGSLSLMFFPQERWIIDQCISCYWLRRWNAWVACPVIWCFHNPDGHSSSLVDGCSTHIINSSTHSVNLSPIFYGQPFFNILLF